MIILCLEKQRGNTAFPWQMGDVQRFEAGKFVGAPPKHLADVTL